MDLDDTIAALSTTPGTAGVAVVKISGPKAYQAAKSVFKPKTKVQRWPARKMLYGYILDKDGTRLDDALACFMPAPASYTRQNVVEIQTHGGLAASAAVLDLLTDKGVRMAEPGEFTRRAFLLGRIDLTQAEATMDIISAKTKAGLVAAGRRLAGGLSEKINALRYRLVEAKAFLEANIDFPEEEIGELDTGAVETALAEVRAELVKLERSYNAGRLFREGVFCVLAGRPNVGKSSLLNALLEKRRAIVAAIPGTTRDAIEDIANFEGIPFRLVDTAGIRVAEDPIEGEGVRITRENIANADLVLLLVDPTEGIFPEDLAILKSLFDKKTIVVVTKSDEVGYLAAKRAAKKIDPKAAIVSNITAEGIEDLRKMMLGAVRGADDLPSDEIILSTARHRQSVLAGLKFLDFAARGLAVGTSPELIAQDIADAMAVLGEVVGMSTPDDVLDLIFSQFCVGK